MSERLTWAQIKEQYPDEWVLLHQVDSVTTEPKIR